MSISDDKERLVAIVKKETKTELESLAKKDGRSLSNYVSNILDTHIINCNKQ